jgi:hypothetical protein
MNRGQSIRVVIPLASTGPYSSTLDPDTSSARLAADHLSQISTHHLSLRRNKTYDIRRSTRARPQVASLLLARAAAVGLPDDPAAEAGRQDARAIGAGDDGAAGLLDGGAGGGHGSEGEEGEDGEGGELHFDGLEVGGKDSEYFVVVWSD